MPTISYKVKGQPFECKREKLSECIEALIEAGRLPEGTTATKVINTGTQRIDYNKNVLPHTESNVKRLAEKGEKVTAEATQI